MPSSKIARVDLRRAVRVHRRRARRRGRARAGCAPDRLGAEMRWRRAPSRRAPRARGARSAGSTGRRSRRRAPGRSSGRGSGDGSGMTSATLSTTVVRRVLRDRDVVRMALAQAGAGDADEARLLHRLDRRRAAVAHRLPQAADELVDDRRERPLVRRRGPRCPPARACRRPRRRPGSSGPSRTTARLHRAERAHPAVLLEALALDERRRRPATRRCRRASSRA